jgi:hypothetical protein
LTAPTSTDVQEAIVQGAKAILRAGFTGSLPTGWSLPVVGVETAIPAGTTLSFLPGSLASEEQPYKKASFSSYGPTRFGLDGPDVAAPGNHYIFSAKAAAPEWAITDSNGNVVSTRYDFDGAIHWMSGTSMATPAISGLMALLRQALLAEGVSAPTSAAMKAIAAAMADPLSGVDGQRTYTGYGIPTLRNWMEIDHTLIDEVYIESAEVQVLEFELTETKDLKIVMCYLDPDMPLENAWPFFADLNLAVVAPDGTVHRGNGMIDQFTTIEAVLLPAAATGTYKVIVSSSEFPTGGDDVFFSLVIRGVKLPLSAGFTKEARSCIPGCTGTCTNGKCVCRPNKAGPLCDQDIVALAKGTPLAVHLRTKEMRYFKFTFPGNDALRLTLTNTTAITNGLFVCLGQAPLTDIADHPQCLTNQFNDFTGLFDGDSVVLPGLPGGEFGGLTYCSSHLEFCDYEISWQSLPANPTATASKSPVATQTPTASVCGPLDGNNNNNAGNKDPSGTVIALSAALALLGVVVIVLVVFMLVCRKGGGEAAEV